MTETSRTGDQPYPRPPDQPARDRALETGDSVLVQAPAGSGKTDLLTRRFLKLLGEAGSPSEIVAITFTRAAAAEMRQRILGELEKAESSARSFAEAGTTGDAEAEPENRDPHSLSALAAKALARSRHLGWRLLDLPGQLRIATIDSFCSSLAQEQPLFSGLGGSLTPTEQPEALYRRAARETLRSIDSAEPRLRSAIEALLLWRDNNWAELEGLLVDMLGQRDRWMQEFVLGRNPDWTALRGRLERPFREAVRRELTRLGGHFARRPELRERLLELARFACMEPGDDPPRSLAESAEFPPTHSLDLSDAGPIEAALDFYMELGRFLLTQGNWRKPGGLNKRVGFPGEPIRHSKAQVKAAKANFGLLVEELDRMDGLRQALDGISSLPPLRYSEEEWRIVQACFLVLRHASGTLKVVFSEAGEVDFTEVAQIARAVLTEADGSPSDAALTIADGIRHLLVDEFQDTSRRQYELLCALISAWPEREGRSCFLVGDPMQSIYGFRDAEVELFRRVKRFGLEPTRDEPLPFAFVPLRANFRTDPGLLTGMNQLLEPVFEAYRDSGVGFTPALPARPAALTQEEADETSGEPRWKFQLHLNFACKTARDSAPSWPLGAGNPAPPGVQSGVQPKNPPEDKPTAAEAQLEAIVSLIRSHRERIARARQRPDGKYRVAVLGRAKSALKPIAAALRRAGIPFRAVELEPLKDRPEVRDALALARALLNPMDRIAWLSILRAPWCGLDRKDLHTLVSQDSGARLARPVPDLLDELDYEEPGHVKPGHEQPSDPAVGERLSRHGRLALKRVWPVLKAAIGGLPTASAEGCATGTWLESMWLRLGGADCVDAEGLENLRCLWRCLDALPAGDLDLFGPALDAALDRMSGQPDPETSSRCGVQLMTIHKSKGLEFEVVIVPDLQRASGKGELRLLSWLERGLERGLDRGLDRERDAEWDRGEDGVYGERTEFLVAPIQTKGTEGGRAKKWVDQVLRGREIAERCRLLYVAATRAREELHLFARPEFQQNAFGGWVLPVPRPNDAMGSLLATAWPGIGAEVERQFEQFRQAANRELDRESGQELDRKLELGAGPARSSAPVPDLIPAWVPALAAAAEPEAEPMPESKSGLRRLPSDYAPQAVGRIRAAAGATSAGSQSIALGFGEFGRAVSDGGETGPQYTGQDEGRQSRPVGGTEARAEGIAVHALLEKLAKLRRRMRMEQATAQLEAEMPRIAALLAGHGIPRGRAMRLAAGAISVAQEAGRSPAGRWVLAPYPEAAEELRLTGLLGNARQGDSTRGLGTVRIDRVFPTEIWPNSPLAQANSGATTAESGAATTWWVLDYKTERLDSSPDAMEEQAKEQDWERPGGEQSDRTALLAHRRSLHAGQLETYARVIRDWRQALDPEKKSMRVHAGLFYPHRKLLDTWTVLEG